MVSSCQTDPALLNSVFSPSDFRTEQGCHCAFDRLLNLSDKQLALEDLGLVNLLCAVGLPSADALDIPGCLVKLNELAEYVRVKKVEWNPRYLANPDPQKGSLAVFRLWSLMHAVRLKVGIEAKYENGVKLEVAEPGPYDSSIKPPGGPYQSRVNSQTGFIHGLLIPQSVGSCASNPVLFAAIGRRLGYPVKLILTVQHIFNRWVDDKEQFNMDGCMKKIGGDADHHYVDRWRKWKNWERISTALHRPLTPREELGVFLFNRCNCEFANLRYSAAIESCKMAILFQPDQKAYVDELRFMERSKPDGQPRMSWQADRPEIVNAMGCFTPTGSTGNKRSFDADQMQIHGREHTFR